MRGVCEAVVTSGRTWAGVVQGVSYIDVCEIARSVVGVGCESMVSTASAFAVHAERIRQWGGKTRLYINAFLNMTSHDELVRISHGWGGLRMHRSHAKMALFAAGERRIGILTSANLNRNRRWEQYVVSGDDRLCRGIRRHLEALEKYGAEPWQDKSSYSATYARAFGIDGIEDKDLLALAGRIEHEGI